MMAHTKDKTMIVLTPAMVAVGCAEGAGLVGGRCKLVAAIQQARVSLCNHV